MTYGTTNTGGIRLQSPTAASSAIANTTSYTVQYYYKTSGATAVTNGQRGISPDGTTQPGTYTATTMTGTSGVWTKIQVSQTSGSSSNTPRYGVGVIRYSNASAVNADYDDYVIYSGGADNTAANPPGTVTVNNPTTSSLDVSWVGATGGVDGGGYVVVRYSTSPNSDNDPNQQGIYAVGNTTTNGTGSLVGTIRYIGTGLSFTDGSLAAGTQYWYKVYTVDKAFNYSPESSGNGTTTSTINTYVWRGSTGEAGSLRATGR